MKKTNEKLGTGSNKSQARLDRRLFFKGRPRCSAPADRRSDAFGSPEISRVDEHRSEHNDRALPHSERARS